MVAHELEVELTASPASIARARAVARRFAENCGADPEDIALAASEAVTNALVHGYRDESRGTIALRAYRDGDDCVFEVTDRGVGMRPHPDAPGLGLGLPVITAVSGSVEIVSLAQGTAIRMRFPRV